MIYPTKHLSVASFASSWFSAHHPFLTWATEGGWCWRMLLPPSWTKLALRLIAENMGTSILMMSLDSVVPIYLSWPAPYLDLLQLVRGIFFLNKIRSKKVSWVIFSTPANASPYPRWRVVEIYTLNISRVQLQSKSPGDIYLQFFWSFQCYFTTSTYVLSANCVWTCCPLCNHQYNALPCTP